MTAMFANEIEARASATEINRYWNRRGVDVKAHAVSIRGERGAIEWSVESDLIGGLPRGWTAEKLKRVERALMMTERT